MLSLNFITLQFVKESFNNLSSYFENLYKFSVIISNFLIVSFNLPTNDSSKVIGILGDEIKIAFGLITSMANSRTMLYALFVFIYQN